MTTSDQVTIYRRAALATGNDGDGRVEGWLFQRGDVFGGHYELTDGLEKRRENNMFTMYILEGFKAQPCECHYWIFS